MFYRLSLFIIFSMGSVPHVIQVGCFCLLFTIFEILDAQPMADAEKVVDFGFYLPIGVVLNIGSVVLPAMIYKNFFQLA